MKMTAVPQQKQRWSSSPALHEWYYFLALMAVVAVWCSSHSTATSFVLRPSSSSGPGSGPTTTSPPAVVLSAAIGVTVGNNDKNNGRRSTLPPAVAGALYHNQQRQNPSTSSSSSSSLLRQQQQEERQKRDAAVKRAWEISSVLTERVVVPILSTLSQGLPESGDEFWARSSSSKQKQTNAECLVEALEELGPTYIKFGQALSSRQDIVPTQLAEALSQLQDDMRPSFNTTTAQSILRKEWSSSRTTATKLDDNDQNAIITKEQQNIILDSLSSEPVAAASIGQCYRATIPGFGPVAVKIQRPGVVDVVQRDEILLTQIAEFVESLEINGKKIVASKLANAVTEFMARLYEELDYLHEVENMEKFAELYCHRRAAGKNGSSSNNNVRVVVPQVLQEYCTENVITMEWFNGTKLTDIQDQDKEENLEVLRLAGISTLSQLFDTGIMHADPHAGNLLKVLDGSDILLGYLDFGMLSTVPETVRDALVCAVAQLVFGRNVEATADLFGELQLLPEDVLQTRRQQLAEALDQLLGQAFYYPPPSENGATAIPEMRFDKVLGGLVSIATQFEFQLPPYFLNNARALGTLEGITKKLDPSHNTMTAIYPVAVKRLFGNPSQSKIVEKTLLDLVHDSDADRVTVRRLQSLLQDVANFSGQSKRQVVRDILKEKGGRRMTRKIARRLVRGYLKPSKRPSIPREPSLLQL